MKSDPPLEGHLMIMTKRRASTVVIDEDSSDEGLISHDQSPKTSGSPWEGRLRRHKSERGGPSHDGEVAPPRRSPARLFAPTRPKTVNKTTARLLAGGSGDYEDPGNAETFDSDDDLSDFIVEDEADSQDSPSADKGDSDRSSDAPSSQEPGPLPKAIVDSDSSEELPRRDSTRVARRKIQATVSSSSSSGENTGPSTLQVQGASRPHHRLRTKAALTTPERVSPTRRRASSRQPAKRPCVAEIVHRRQSEWQQELQAPESTKDDDDVSEGSTTGSGTSESDGVQQEVAPSLTRTAASREAKLDRVSAALDVSIRSYTLREEFEIYCEYRLLTDIDSSYAGLVESDPHYRRYYGKAVGAIEWKLRQARDAAASTFWRSCAPGLVEALELLPGADSAWDSEEAGGHLRWLEEEAASHAETCEACNRTRSHATKILRLHGRFVRPETIRIGERRLSDAFECASPQYRRQNEHEGRDLPTRFKQVDETGRYCAQYHVGRFCCARLLLFHALEHWERRLRARLRHETKRARRMVVGDYDKASVAAKVLGNNELLRELFDIFQRLCSASERYALSGGEGLGGRYGGTSSTNETVFLTEKLHPDSEGEESSVVWGDSSSDEEPEQENPCSGPCPRGGPVSSSSEPGSSLLAIRKSPDTCRESCHSLEVRENLFLMRRMHQCLTVEDKPAFNPGQSLVLHEEEPGSRELSISNCLACFSPARRVREPCLEKECLLD